ncbi:MAG: hypothetical protein E6X17_02285 [Sporomusaceae bacterium]|nr:hypothetical protein [Sporomusaceae bacterium]
MCKYNHHQYWESLLPKNPWQGSFAAKNMEQAVFVNTVIIDHRRDILDNNWASYPNIKSLLGFLQYLHLPLVFFHTLRPDKQELLVPVCSSAEFLELIDQSGSERAPAMRQALAELDRCWQLDDEQCLLALRNFCRGFNALWQQGDYILNIGIFADTLEIARYILDQNPFPEVLEEDTGLTPGGLLDMCNNFYHEPLLRRNFVKLLNHKIGCVI